MSEECRYCPHRGTVDEDGACATCAREHERADMLHDYRMDCRLDRENDDD